MSDKYDTYKSKALEEKVKGIIRDIKKDISIIENKFGVSKDKINKLKDTVEYIYSKYDPIQASNDAISIIDTMKSDNQAAVSEFYEENPTNTEIINEVPDVNSHIDDLKSYVNGRVDLTVSHDPTIDNSDKILPENSGFNNISKFIKPIYNESMENIIGYNAMKSNKFPNSALQLSSFGEISRNIVLKLYDSNDILIESDIDNNLPFTENYDPIRYLYDRPAESTPVIIIERDNEVYSYSWGITLVTRNPSYVVHNDINQIDSIDPFNNSAYVRIEYSGYINIDDSDKNNPKITHSINNSANRILNDSPKFNFRFSYDKDNFYILLEDITPNRIITFKPETDINNESDVDILFIRDIVELYSTDDTIGVDDTVQTLIDYYGDKGRGLSDINNISTGLLSFLNDHTVHDSPKGCYLIPKYIISLSLKDHSYGVRTSFDIKNINAIDNLLDKDYVNLNIYPKNTGIVQLFGIPLSNSNNIKVSNNSMKRTFVNTSYDRSIKKFISNKPFSLINSESDSFIKSIIHGTKPVYFRCRLYSSYRLNSNNAIETNKIPDIIIDLFSKYDPTKYENYYNYTGIAYDNKDTNIDITNFEELDINIREKLSGISLFDRINNSNPEYINYSSNMPGTNKVVVVKPDTIFGSKALDGINMIFDGVLFRDDYKGFIRVEIEILNGNYGDLFVSADHITNVSGDLSYFGKTDFGELDEFELNYQLKNVNIIKNKM